MIGVLVVDDDVVAAEAHATYVGRLEGFRVVAKARTCREAAHRLAQAPVDLVLLDMRLPDGSGAELLRRMRAGHMLCDVIVVTSARDLQLLRRCMSLGVVDYLLKPFTFATFRGKLHHYARHHRQMATTDRVVQAEVDRLFATLHPLDTDALPKGLDEVTLQTVTDHLRAAPAGRSAQEVADMLGISRVTARRYLEHLSTVGSVRRGNRHGGLGRPEIEYLWRAAPPPHDPPAPREPTEFGGSAVEAQPA
jgi:response regulator of citrate/malate metabolism